MTTSPLLPERARLLHVGLPKTGTTALQHTAVKARRQLSEAGVLYPATLTAQPHHLLPAAALMDRRVSITGGVPGPEHWRDLKERIEADESRRIWLSHEWICESDLEQAQRFRDELGERLHVVVSVRQYGTLLTSTWQEFLKSRMIHDFEEWLEFVLTDREAADTGSRWQVEHTHKRTQQDEIVRRWAQAVGPENVTVVVVDPSQRSQLTDAFEDLLGLQRGMLSRQDAGSTSNRSMTVEEARLMLGLNRAYAADESPLPKQQQRLPVELPRLLLNRAPDAHERKLAMPTWAAEIADERGRTHADGIERTGVRVIGDLDALRVPTRATDVPDHNRADAVPVEAAVRAAEAIALAVRKERQQDDADGGSDDADSPQVDDTRAVDLAKEVARRAADRVKRRLGRDGS